MLCLVILEAILQSHFLNSNFRKKQSCLCYFTFSPNLACRVCVWSCHYTRAVEYSSAIICDSLRSQIYTASETAKPQAGSSASSGGGRSKSFVRQAFILAYELRVKLATFTSSWGPPLLWNLSFRIQNTKLLCCPSTSITNRYMCEQGGAPISEQWLRLQSLSLSYRLSHKSLAPAPSECNWNSAMVASEVCSEAFRRPSKVTSGFSEKLKVIL